MGNSKNSSHINIENGIVTKRVLDNKKNCFEREVYWLKKLSSEKCFPRLISYDPDQLVIQMTHVGDSLADIDSKRIPSNYKEQINGILQILKKYNCVHNDLTLEELTLLNGKIHLVDFGWASLNNDFSCEIPEISKERKMRRYADEDIVGLVEKRFFWDNTRVNEMQIFILWKNDVKEFVLNRIKEKFTVLRCIDYQTSFFKNRRQKFLSKIYENESRLGLSNAKIFGDKGKTPFSLIIVLDTMPKYDYMKTTSGIVTRANVNMFNLKQDLRKQRVKIHCSNTSEEAHDNLRALSNADRIPLDLWYIYRPRFSSLREWFNVLNKNSVNYVILRNFDNYPDAVKVDNHCDIDYMTDDYFLTKGISGGKQFKHELPKGNKGFGPRLEDNGYKVCNKIVVQGKEVMLDIRHIGDNYYDRVWQITMLEKKVKKVFGEGEHDYFWVLDLENYFYSLLYHALIHKKKISKTYLLKFDYLSKELGVPLDTTNRKYMKLTLEKWLIGKGYNFVRPNELNIHYNL